MELRHDTVKVHTGEREISTKGRGEMIDITPFVSSEVEASLVSEGTATVFVPGATAGLTTIEFEDGLVHDFNSLWERLVPGKQSLCTQRSMGRWKRSFTRESITSGTFARHPCDERQAHAGNVAADYSR